MFVRLMSFALLLLAAACAAPAAAPSGAPADETPRSGGTATYVIRSDPPAWDIWGREKNFDPTRMTAEMVFNPLYLPAANVGEGCELKIEPELAESWKYLDDKTIEFKLRQGVKFHNKPPVNGREMVADDVAFMLEERFKKGLWGSGYVGQLFYDRAEAVDKYTVRLHLKKPFNFITEFADGHRQGWVQPKEALGPDGKEWLQQAEKSWIGTGPFVLKEVQSGVKLVFDKNPQYFKQGKPYLDRIEALIIPDTATRLAALRSSQLDIYPAAAPGVVQEIKRTNPEMFVKSCPDQFALGLHFRQDRAPYNDVRVRRALSMALNRDVVVQNALRGDGMAMYQLWPLDPEASKLPDFPPAARGYMEYKPEEAKKLLADAGFPRGFPMRIHWTPQFESPWQEVAESFVTMFRDIGIDARLEMKEYAAYLRTLSELSYEETAFSWTNSYSMDFVGAEYYWSKRQPVNTLSLAPDAKLDGMVEELWGARNPEKHKQLARTLQTHTAEQSYYLLSPVWGNGVIAVPRIKNLGWRGTNKMYTPLFEQVWLAR